MRLDRDSAGYYVRQMLIKSYYCYLQNLPVNIFCSAAVRPSRQPPLVHFIIASSESLLNLVDSLLIMTFTSFRLNGRIPAASCPIRNPKIAIRLAALSHYIRSRQTTCRCGRRWCHWTCFARRDTAEHTANSSSHKKPPASTNMTRICRFDLNAMIMRWP